MKRETKRKRPFMDWPFLVFLFFAVVGPVGTKIYVFYNQILVTDFYLWMDEQPKVSAQAGKSFFADGHAMRNAVDNTVAREATPYPFKNKPDLAKALANPLLVTADVLANGKDRYEIFCSVCHGLDGAGKGTLRGNHFTPPSLHSQKLRETFNDGQLFHLISDGQNVMPAYAKQLTPDERWAVVHYVRALQRSQAATAEDLKRKIKIAVQTSDKIAHDAPAKAHH